jgi:hypothetical protein
LENLSYQIIARQNLLLFVCLSCLFIVSHPAQEFLKYMEIVTTAGEGLQYFGLY